MQIAPQIILSESTNPDVRLKEFAHQLAETHKVEISHPKKTDLLEHVQSWKLILRKE